MTAEFEKITKTPTQIQEAVLDIMCFGKFDEKKERIRSYSPFLAQVESFIRYYEKDITRQAMPIFLSFSQNDATKRILVEYLATRQALLNPITRNRITQEASKSNHTVSNRRKIQINLPGTDRDGRMNLDAIRIRFYKFVYDRIYKRSEFNDYINKKSYENYGTASDIILCRNGFVPSAQTDLIKYYCSIKEFNPSCALSFNTRYNAINFMGKEKKLQQIPQDSCVVGNGFMIYTRNEPGKFSLGDLNVLGNQHGYYIANMFVFALIDKPFNTGSLSRYASTLRNKYGNNDNTQIFFLDADETRLIKGEHPISRNQLLIGNDDDYLSYYEEIRYILDGCEGLKHSLRNTIALCCDSSFEQEFNKLLTGNGFDEIDHISDLGIFNYMRTIWDEVITKKILESVGEDMEIAFVIEKLAYSSEVLKKAIAEKFPNKNVNFYLLSDLRQRKDGNRMVDVIPERHIFQLRYSGFNERYISYPNSYDLTILDSDKTLVDIIPLALFGSNVIRSENAIAAFYNKLENIPYRKNCLGWEKIPTKDYGNYRNYDDGDDSIPQSTDGHSALQIKVTLENGKSYTRDDSDEVVYKKNNGEICFGKLSELVEPKDVYSIQFMDELEGYLGSIANKVGQQDIEAERIFKQRMIEEGKMDDIKDVEIWRAMLIKKIEQVGIERITEDLNPKIGKYYKNLSHTISDRWVDINAVMILPRHRAVKTTIFEYLGIPRHSPYWGIVQRRRSAAVKQTRERNILTNQLIKAILNKKLDNTSFDKLYSTIPDSLDLMGIMSNENLIFIQKGLQEEALNLRELKKIRYEE